MMKTTDLRALKESICGKDDDVAFVAASLCHDFFVTTLPMQDVHTVSGISNHTEFKKTPTIANMTSLRCAS